jgi:hypothetical protein
LQKNFLTVCLGQVEPRSNPRCIGAGFFYSASK